MYNRVFSFRSQPLPGHIVVKRILLRLGAIVLLAGSVAYGAGFVPPENLNPGQSAQPTLDSSYDQEAWLVYTYDIDTDGRVANTKIHVSNGVTAVEDKIVNHVNAMRFRPATRNDKPVKVFVGPIVYTWILDVPRQMSPQFEEIYDRAWAFFNDNKYDEAFELALQLKNIEGRNAYEEIKFQILGASLASRWGDDSSELEHLNRIVEFQSLADRNRFKEPYVPTGQYLLMLERIGNLLLGKNRLADAEATLNKMLISDPAAKATNRLQGAYQDAEQQFRSQPDIEIWGVLTPIYRGGQGIWESRLFRNRFSIGNVKGNIESIYLACQGGRDMRLRHPSKKPWTTPAGWSSCKLEVAGRSGTRFVVHQLAP